MTPSPGESLRQAAGSSRRDFGLGSPVTVQASLALGRVPLARFPIKFRRAGVEPIIIGLFRFGYPYHDDTSSYIVPGVTPGTLRVAGPGRLGYRVLVLVFSRADSNIRHSQVTVFHKTRTRRREGRICNLKAAAASH